MSTIRFTTRKIEREDEDQRLDHDVVVVLDRLDDPATRRPFQANTVSVSTAPASSPPTCSPMTVTTGSQALRMMWRLSTRRSEMPLARAVRT